MEANQLYQMKSIPRQVYTLETGALSQGRALVIDPVNIAVSAVTVQDKARGKYAVTPTYLKDILFAGVLKQGKTSLVEANFAEVDQPGSDTLIYMAEAVTAGQVVYFDCGDQTAGQFRLGGIGRGRGAAVVHTTLTTAGFAHATLLNGEEVGGVQYLVPVAAGGAITPSLNGMTLINGGTVNDAHITATLADGTFIGQTKAIKVHTLIGNTKNFVLTVTNGVQLNGSTALASITFNAADEQSVLVWMGAHWKLIANSGATLA